jgi:hypothetical protein
MPGLPWIILGLTAPTLAVLLSLSFVFARTPGQRMANLLTGFFFSVIAIVAFVAWLEMRQVEVGDEALFVFVLAPIGAACGVAIARSMYWFFGRQQR